MAARISMKPAISVVVPVFNTGRLIERCLDSVQGQTFRDLEIICIDDGSTDITPRILNERALDDDRIKVIILPENHGVPYTRNIGIDVARGEFLYYMDSDDWIDPDYLEAMHSKAVSTGQNVVINGNWYLEYDDPSKRAHCGRFGFVHEEAGYYPPVVVQSKFFPVVWSRLYSLEYIRDRGIRSPLMKGGVDDNYFTAMAEILQERSYIFNGPFYHYYQREGSLVRQPDAAFHHFENFRIFLDELHRRNIPPQAARRYFTLEGLVVDSQERFDFLKRFFIDVEPDVRACPNLYGVMDVFMMKVFVTSPDYESFTSWYGKTPSLRFNAKVFRDGYYPTSAQILDGSWWVR